MQAAAAAAAVAAVVLILRARRRPPARARLPAAPAPAPPPTPAPPPATLYPPPRAAAFYRPGRHVVVLKKGKVFAQGSVARGVVRAGPYAGRVLVRFGDGSSAHIRPNMLVPCLDEDEGEGAAAITRRVITATTDMYRRMAKAAVRADEFVVEIGSDWGATTAVIDKHCRRAVGVDKSKRHVEEAREKHPSIEFVCADVLVSPESLLALHESGAGISVVFIDINGNRLLRTVLECAALVERLLSPRLIVIKSQAAFDDALRRQMQQEIHT